MDNVDETMGASNANNLARLAALQERKRYIEETLAKRTHELRQLCVREAELTGLTPPEMPLEPGEAPPQYRRKVGTSYQLPESLVENVVAHKDELIAELELQIKVHANMAEAALGLANGHGQGKTIKRQHKNEYQKHKQQCSLLQDRLDKLKEREREQHRLKKKQPRVVVDVEKATVVEPFHKSSEVRHSMRSSKYGGEVDDDPRRTPSFRCSETPVQLRQEDVVTSSGIYRLSLNGYSRYMERREHHSHHISDGYSAYSPSHYAQQYNGPQSPHFYHHNYPPPHRPYNYYQEYSAPSSYYRPPSSPSKTPPSSHQYYPYEYGIQRDETVLYRSSQVLQPHQQYESHPNVVSMGLGGCWKQNENGELVWANSSVSPGGGENAWQYREKKHPATGVLDRRKNKKIPKQRAYHLSAADKSATLGSVPNYHGRVSTPRRESGGGGNGGQLVRTQSLGSVGARTVDSVYPSDDASSCGSENRLLRRNKEKEWTETSLDSPVLAPEDKYRTETPTPPPLPPPPVKVLEIPAESNPSSSPYRTSASNRSAEFFNNNVPVNCTVVQAGQCKPYREETKPFEMSDFYKYSTKFKKSPCKSPAGGSVDGSGGPRRGFDDEYMYNNNNNSNNNNNNVSRV